MIALIFQKAIQDSRSYISNPYGNWYQLRPGVWNYHPGIDILFQEGSIAHCPVKAVSWMQITYAQRCLVPGFEVWGNLIVGRCELRDHTVVYCRYAHVESVLVEVGQWVHPGQHLADVGDAFGNYVYHLDFCISPTKVLALTPWDWPGADLQRVYDNYVDPVSFIERRKTVEPDWTNLSLAMGNMDAAWAEVKAQVKALQAEPEPGPLPGELSATVKESGTRVRALPTVNSSILIALGMSEQIVVIATGVTADGHEWMRITAGPTGSVGGYVAKDLLSFP